MARKNKIILLAIVCLAVVLGGILIFQKGGIDLSAKKEQGDQASGRQTYEAMVVIRDQINPDPEEDRKNSLKRGDVIIVRPEGHEWSGTEYKSYLLVKMELTEKDLEKLLVPLEGEIGKDEKTGEAKKETVIARRYKIDLDKIGFAGSQVISGQPLKDKVFGEEIIEEKE